MQPGDLISGKYRLSRLLGAGGMGSVWAARNELTDRDFAIKFLLPDLARNKEALQRFFHEARACGQIKHAAVVDVYDMGQAEDGSPYIVMEQLVGEGFDERLSRIGRFRPSEAAAWVAFVARGLEEAHVRGLIHRDLKPGNIFFAQNDRGEVLPKVLDFGVSKATHPRDGDFVKTTTGAVLGSPAYMSPEQAKGETDIDARCDIWSLGVILYEAITGRVPFDAPNYNALMVKIMMEPHRPATDLAPETPRELSALIDRALAKDREKRVGSARELAEQLESIVSKITLTPLAQFQPRTTTLSPPPMGRVASTTQGTWSDGRRVAMRPRRYSGVWIAAAFLGCIAVGTVAFLRLRPPMVAVAGRSSVALTAGLARLTEQLDAIEREAAAEQKKRDDEAAGIIVIEPGDLPTTSPSRPSSKGGATTSSPPTKAKPDGGAAKKDPHGGVDSAGF